MEQEIERIRTEREQTGSKVGLLLFEKRILKKPPMIFAMLRDLDDQNVDLILAGALNEKDSIGLAVMNRMLKASGYKVIDV